MIVKIELTHAGEDYIKVEVTKKLSINYGSEEVTEYELYIKDARGIEKVLNGLALLIHSSQAV